MTGLAALIGTRLGLWRQEARRGMRAAVLLASMLLLGTSCGTLSSRITSDPTPAAARLHNGGSIQEEVDRLALPLIESGENYGIAVGILTPAGQVHTYGYGGTGQPGKNELPNGDTLFEIGSLSKLFVAAMLAILVDEGELSYADTVRSIMPTEVPLSEDAGGVTLYELVTNTGGLPRELVCLTQLQQLLEYFFTGHNLYRYLTKPRLYKYLRTCNLKPPSQRSYVYSNIGYGLLAHLMEIKTGRSFPDLVQEKICGPLKMRDTVFVLDAEQKARLAMGHAGDQPRFIRRNRPMEPWDMGEIMRASAGIYSTVNDLMIFAQSTLGLRHHPLDPILASITKAQLTTPIEDVAFCWLINYYDDGRQTVIFKHGMVAGYNAYIGMDVELPVVVVVLCNNFNWNDKIGQNLVLRLSRGLAVRNRETSRYQSN